MTRFNSIPSTLPPMFSPLLQVRYSAKGQGISDPRGSEAQSRVPLASEVGERAQNARMQAGEGQTILLLSVV